ncbi:hypothetical protein PAPYR_2618 [Paratrimastix pyriformis]|uniref:Uncharacterized protein n=1 Tax=Paratrimastix pyriformis TaxID=342808 RepID=A0ABQ8UPQ6_9EUKA|nr:hypothetical protein PAPYR_2618 [Paratrimastix pyriformis]
MSDLHDPPPIPARPTGAVVAGPIQGSSWLIPELVAIGPTPTDPSFSEQEKDHNLRQLLDAGITSFFSLCPKQTEMNYAAELRRLSRARTADERRSAAATENAARPLCAHPHPTPVVHISPSGIPENFDNYTSRQRSRPRRGRRRRIRQKIEFFRVATPPDDVCPDLEFIRIIDLITQRCLFDDRVCYVHSLKGSSRIVPVAAVLLARMYLFTAEEALARVESFHLNRDRQVMLTPPPNDRTPGTIYFLPPDDPRWETDPRVAFEQARRQRERERPRTVRKLYKTVVVTDSGATQTALRARDVELPPEEEPEMSRAVRQLAGQYDRRHKAPAPPGDSDLVVGAQLEEPLDGVRPNTNRTRFGWRSMTVRAALVGVVDGVVTTNAGDLRVPGGGDGGGARVDSAGGIYSCPAHRGRNPTEMSFRSTTTGEDPTVFFELPLWFLALSKSYDFTPPQLDHSTRVVPTGYGATYTASATPPASTCTDAPVIIPIDKSTCHNHNHAHL